MPLVWGPHQVADSSELGFCGAVVQLLKKILGDVINPQSIKTFSVLVLDLKECNPVLFDRRSVSALVFKSTR